MKKTKEMLKYEEHTGCILNKNECWDWVTSNRIHRYAKATARDYEFSDVMGVVRRAVNSTVYEFRFLNIFYVRYEALRALQDIKETNGYYDEIGKLISQVVKDWDALRRNEL